MKAIRCVVLVVLALRVSAESAKPSAPPSLSSVSGAFFALSVPDLKASTGWYTEKLGLRVVLEVPRADKVAVVVLEGGGLIVELIQHDDALPLNQLEPPVAGNQFVHGMFKAGAVVADFEALIKTLRSRGVEIVAGPFPARGGQRANVLIKDNAGNLIQFFGK